MTSLGQGHPSRIIETKMSIKSTIFMLQSLLNEPQWTSTEKNNEVFWSPIEPFTCSTKWDASSEFGPNDHQKDALHFTTFHCNNKNWRLVKSVYFSKQKEKIQKVKIILWVGQLIRSLKSKSVFANRPVLGEAYICGWNSNWYVLIRKIGFFPKNGVKTKTYQYFEAIFLAFSPILYVFNSLITRFRRPYASRFIRCLKISHLLPHLVAIILTYNLHL